MYRQYRFKTPAKVLAYGASGEIFLPIAKEMSLEQKLPITNHWCEINQDGVMRITAFLVLWR